MSLPTPILWAYAYRLVPPLPADRLRRLRALLDEERRAARARAGTWEGRLVVDDRVAHLLVLCDSPDLDREVNLRIEAELRALDAQFALTVPLAVAGDATDEPVADPELPPTD